MDNSDFDWGKAVLARDMWVLLHNENKVRYNLPGFIEYLQYVSTTNKAGTIRTCDVVLNAYSLFETLTEEEKITVTLMGW